MSDIFNPENELKNKNVNWNVPGEDFLVGVLLSHSVKQVKSLKDGTMQDKHVYEIKAKEGSWHNLDDRKKLIDKPELAEAGDTIIMWGRPGIDAQMKKIKIGQVFGAKFTEEFEPSQKGFNPTKIIKVYTSGEMDPEVMEGVGAEVDPMDSNKKAFGEM